MNKFIKAKPIWINEKEKEMNLCCGFRTVINVSDYEPCSSFLIRITASSTYRIFANGEFLGYGPARAAHGYYRIDEWSFKSLSTSSPVIVAIEVIGYNVNSYYLLDQPSFLQAEIVADGNVVKFTSEKSTDFLAEILKEKIQRVQRYSFQRTFTECYRYEKNSMLWHKEIDIKFGSECCAEFCEKSYLDRNVTYPIFQKSYPVRCIDCGIVESLESNVIIKDRSLTNIGENFKGYQENELEIHLTDELQKFESTSNYDKSFNVNFKSSYKSMVVSDNSYVTLEFSGNKTGFIESKIVCNSRSTVYFVFDEIITENDVDFLRLQCANAVKYELEPGNYELLTMEPYTLKYIKVICIDGECDIKSIAIVEYSSPIEINIEFNKMNLQMTKIIESGLETFKQNSVDIYMDCPSRERAGWLCDSFFMARTEFCLTGESVIERNFLENYMLPEKFDFIPDGMLPMCYPADHYDGNFIPNWSLWFALQIKEYHDRSGDDELIKKLKSKMDKLLQYFIKYENELELLENLEGWVFVEWSHANDLTDGINFPSNMLYAGALESLGILYSDQNLVDKACRIRKVILGLSNSKTLFFDRAIRKNGVIEVINESTEVCQYYAFFFKVATPITHPKLWRILVNEFGPKRKNSNNYPQVAFANAFFGLYLRLDILSTYGLHGKSICEIEEYFLAMADLTGTLWEHDSPLASCNHGFASYILFIISKQ